MRFGEILKNLRTKNRYTQDMLSQKIGVSKSTVSMYELGERMPTAETLTVLAELFGVTVDYLLGNGVAHQQESFTLPPNVRPIKTQKFPIFDSPYIPDSLGHAIPTPSDSGVRKFPVLGKVACGKPIFADEEHEAFVSADADIKADFCLIAQGDSMIGARILDGDVVFIRSQEIVENGQIAAVIIDDEATLKRWNYYPEKAQLVLTPENPAYAPLVYVGEELNSVRCLGLAVCFMSNL